MSPDIFLINRTDQKTIALLKSVSLPVHEIDFFSTITHDEKRSELIDRRKALRFYIGQKLGVAPELIPILKGPDGSVFVEGLSVSVASRRNYIAVALGNHALGIDIETSIKNIPYAVLHSCEIEHLGKAKDLPLAAAMIWAAKESAWKALALSITTDPTSIGVCLENSGDFTVKFTANFFQPVALKGRVYWHNELQAAVAYCSSKASYPDFKKYSAYLLVHQLNPSLKTDENVKNWFEVIDNRFEKYLSPCD